MNGLGVSPGVAIGAALVLQGPGIEVDRVPIDPPRVADEVSRFREAVGEGIRQLRAVRTRVRREAGDACARIFEAQVLILKDRALMKETVARIRGEKVNAAWAFHSVLSRFREIFAQVEDVDLRDRDGDIEDVEARVQSILAGRRRQEDLAGLREDVILIGAALSPSAAAGLNRRHVIGLAIEGGGRTSHTAILAAGLGVPAVVGLQGASARIRTGDRVVLDGTDGVLVRWPSESDLPGWLDRRDRLAERERDLEALAGLPAVTPDGQRIVLQANIDLPQEVALAGRHGAEGIGLYRSEFLYLNDVRSEPSEERQFATYRDLAERALPHELVIRTLDLGAEKSRPGQAGRSGIGAALGLRGIRLALSRPDLFRTQLRAIFRAAAHGKVRILLPMVGRLEDVVQAKILIEEARRDVMSGSAGGDLRVPIGIMIEIPSAALIADRLMSEVDFVSIGTNDLIQYALAVDRANDSVSYLYEPLHPAMLRLIGSVVESATRHGRRLSV
ncbi:MAG TPA: phosphoenolpyruvate--protein phosphotransferase, partial [Candidatus Polarisedimenticolia bacterium]